MAEGAPPGVAFAGIGSALNGTVRWRPDAAGCSIAHHRVLFVHAAAAQQPVRFVRLASIPELPCRHQSGPGHARPECSGQRCADG